VSKKGEDNMARKCDIEGCNRDATHFESPLGNPDEGALCDEHYRIFCETMGQPPKRGKYPRRKAGGER
jgi:hypothetical protein